MNPTITVDADDRGRLTIDEPARVIASIAGTESEVRLRIRVLHPDDVADETATTPPVVTDERGRVTIPAGTRRELGIDGRESILQIEVEKVRGGGT